MGVALYQLKMLKLIVVLAMAAFVFAAGDAEWLADKANEDGVITLPSGLMYKVVNSGDESGASPGPRTPCDVHYAGRLIDGTEFDSSYKRGKPATFAPNQVIKGWTEALQLMKEGDKWELNIPADLAYGQMQRGPHIYPGAALIFDIELIKVNGPRN